MDRQLWNRILLTLKRLDKHRRDPRKQFQDYEIAAVHFWAVVHDRPVSWAVEECNWPCDLRRRQPRVPAHRALLPSNATMSRRLREASVQRLIKDLEAELLRPDDMEQSGLVWLVDGKPLPIGGCSKDRQAGYGRAAGCKAKGYKLHVLCSAGGAVVGWRVSPMNSNERTMAGRIIRDADVDGYVVGDCGYDANRLHQACRDNGRLRLLAPRRDTSKGLAAKNTPERLQAVEQFEGPFPEFAADLRSQRWEIERRFGNWSSRGGGLTHLPPWVRTHRRVSRWVQAKLILCAVYRRHHQPHSVA